VIFRPSTLVHYLLCIEGVGIVGRHLLWCDTRIFHWQIVYLMWVNNVFLLRHALSHLCWRTIYRSMNSLILGQLGSIAFVSKLTETTSTIRICCLVHLIHGTTLILRFCICRKEVVLCISSQWANSRIIKLSAVNCVLISVIFIVKGVDW